MILQIDLATHTTLAEVRQFLEALAPSRAEAYAHVERTLRQFSYWKLPKKAERGLLRTYLQRTTGLSRAQVARLIAAYLASQGAEVLHEVLPVAPALGRSGRAFAATGDGLHLSLDINLGIDVGRRQLGVAELGANCMDVRPRPQQVRRRGVPDHMRPHGLARQRGRPQAAQRRTSAPIPKRVNGRPWRVRKTHASAARPAASSFSRLAVRGRSGHCRVLPQSTRRSLPCDMRSRDSCWHPRY